MRIRKSIASHLSLLFRGLFLFLLTVSPAHAYDVVSFPSIDGNTHLTAFLGKPEGRGPFPAVVLMHGCGGISQMYSSWAKELNDQGFATLTVDSAGSRNLGVTCGDREKRMRMYRERPFDAYGALEYLQSQDFILPGRIGLVGWSQGGGIVLLTVVSGSIARPVPAPRHDFVVAAAFYPALCNDKLQSRPFTKVAPQSWSTKIPLMVLQGQADNWTRPEPCESFIEAARKRGNPVSIVLYPNAYHGFDMPGEITRTLPQYKTMTGVIPVIGPYPAARADALKRLPAFLGMYLLPEKAD
jgi:dienelactone hydrolase